MPRPSDNFNDVLLYQQYTRDTQTGQTYVVPMGHGGTQWMDARGGGQGVRDGSRPRVR